MAPRSRSGFNDSQLWPPGPIITDHHSALSRAFTARTFFILGCQADALFLHHLKGTGQEAMLASPFPAHAVREGLHCRLSPCGCPGQRPLPLNDQKSHCLPRQKTTTKSAFDQASCQQKKVIKVDVYITKVGTQEITFCKVSSLDMIFLARPEGRTRQ